mgnify:CR=1 FL=1
MYQLTAEHITQSTAIKLIDNSTIDIVHARMDDTFTSLVHIVVDTKEDAEAMRALLWEANGGAYCDMSTITEDELEEYL